MRQISPSGAEIKKGRIYRPFGKVDYATSHNHFRTVYWNFVDNRQHACQGTLVAWSSLEFDQFNNLIDDSLSQITA